MTEKKKSGVSVVVPVFNSEQSIPPLIEKLGEVLPQLASDYEVILVNDCSRDRSWEVIREAGARDPRIRGIHMSRNFGQHNALLCGIRAARHPVVVTMDDDLQNPPDEVPRLLAALSSDVDVVYGYPGQQEHGFLRNVASTITKLILQKAMGVESARHISAFRAFRTMLRDGFSGCRGSDVNIDVLLTWATHRFKAIEVRWDPRTMGASNYTVSRLLRHALNMLTGFSIVPLQLAGWFGLFFAAFGLAILLYVLGRYLVSGSSTPGFPFLASIISIFAGAQLCALGIIGEYLARMHDRTVGRPAYSIRETLNLDNRP